MVTQFQWFVTLLYVVAINNEKLFVVWQVNSRTLDYINELIFYYFKTI